MKVIRMLFIGALFLIIAPVFAQDVEQNTQSTTASGFISDDLFIYMHSGAGKNYRIIGTINAGTQVKLTGNTANDYTEIRDENNKTSWVESQYIAEKPGLRFVVAELNSQIASAGDNNSQLDAQLNQLKDTINNLTEQNTSLKNEVLTLNTTLVSTQSKLKDQDTNIKKQWFFNGAIVLGVGLILGLVLPRLFTRRRSKMDSWG